jgi:hypothetical protein
MFIIQNEGHPGEIQNALYDLMRDGIEGVRVCSAYITIAGSEILFDGIRRSAANGDAQRVRKIVVASLDFGLTDPEALEFWAAMPLSNVLVAGAPLLDRGNLVPHTAFHPKFYIFDRPDGAVGSMVGSANLTNRGLTINSEVARCERNHRGADGVNAAWDAAVQAAAPLTQDILDRYRELRRRVARPLPTEETQAVPAPAIRPIGHYTPFADLNVEPGAYAQMWVQARGMQGGARTQLELPRRSHRFFGAAYNDYDFERVDHIAEPVLVSGQRRWRDRPLTWHGDNAMERINLPSVAMGGFEYENSLILFRRVAPNTFELRVYPWESDSAHAYVEASRRAGLISRVGRNSNRIAGLLP